jgi:hypothetical protein
MDETCEKRLKTCLKCGIPQPLESFPFNKTTQKHRNPCKACLAALSKARRNDPERGPIIRERERIRSARRLPYLKKWAREHHDNLRPYWQRRWAEFKAKRDALRPPPDTYTYRPLLGPFRVVLPPPKRGRPPKGGRGSNSSGDPSARP